MGKFRIPLSVLTEQDVSFTYCDSMLSRWWGRGKPVEYHQTELHGKVFTFSEILSIVEKRGMLEEDREVKLPKSIDTDLAVLSGEGGLAPIPAP